MSQCRLRSGSSRRNPNPPQVRTAQIRQNHRAGGLHLCLLGESGYLPLAVQLNDSMAEIKSQMDFIFAAADNNNTEAPGWLGPLADGSTGAASASPRASGTTTRPHTDLRVAGFPTTSA